MALASDIGCQTALFTTAEAFGEDQGRYVVTVEYKDEMPVIEEARAAGIIARRIGHTFGGQLGFDNGGKGRAVSLADLRGAHQGFFPELMGADAALA